MSAVLIWGRRRTWIIVIASDYILDLAVLLDRQTDYYISQTDVVYTIHRTLLQIMYLMLSICIITIHTHRE